MKYLYTTHRKLAFGIASIVIGAVGGISCSGRAIVRETPETTATSDAAPSETVHLTNAQENTKKAVRNAEATAEYHFSLAQAYVAEGNPDRAIEEFKLTLMFDPNSGLVRARLAAEYIKKGMLSDAMESCKEALQKDPNYIDARLLLAGLYAALREPQAALTEYERILKQDQKHEEAAVFKSQILIEENRGADAVESLDAFLKKMPDSYVGWYYRGRAEVRLEHFKEAANSFKKALDIHSNFAQAALALGALYEEQRQNADAIAVYKSLFESNQDLTAANRMTTILLKEEKYSVAVPFLEAIIATDPEDMNARVKLGLVQMELKQFDQAVGSFKGILAKNPDSDRIHYYLGSVYEEQKKNDLAIEELKKIKPESKLFTDAVLHVGYLLKQGNRFAEAKDFIKEALNRAPRTANFYIFQASLEEDGKNVDGAVAVLEKAVSTFPQDERIRYFLGSLYDRKGDTDRGLAQMEEILKLNPQNVDALNYIGYTWTLKGVRLPDAEKLLKKALSLKPDNGFVQDSWGWYLYVRGRMDEAVVELEKAAKLKPNEPTILEHLADAYLRSNLREKAMQLYSDAAKISGDDAIKRKLEAKAENVRTELAKGKSGADAERVPASQ